MLCSSSSSEPESFLLLWPGVISYMSKCSSFYLHESLTARGSWVFFGSLSSFNLCGALKLIYLSPMPFWQRNFPTIGNLSLIGNITPSFFSVLAWRLPIVLFGIKPFFYSSVSKSLSCDWFIFSKDDADLKNLVISPDDSFY